MCPPMRTHWRQLVNMIDLCFLRPTRVHNPNCKLIGSAIFAQLVEESPYTLQPVPLSLKIAPTHGGSGHPSNTWFLGPIWAHNPNGISVGSAVFCRAHWCCRPPDRPCYVLLRCGLIHTVCVWLWCRIWYSTKSSMCLVNRSCLIWETRLSVLLTMLMLVISVTILTVSQISLRRSVLHFLCCGIDS